MCSHIGSTTGRRQRDRFKRSLNEKARDHQEGDWILCSRVGSRLRAQHHLERDDVHFSDLVRIIKIK